MRKKLLSIILITALTVTACGMNSVDLEKTAKEQVAIEQSSVVESTIQKEESTETSIKTFIDSEVDIIYPIFNFGDKSDEEFVESVKEENTDAIDVRIYEENKDYYVVTMLESKRQEKLALIAAEFGNSLSDMMYTDEYNHAIVRIDYDDTFENITLYADKDLYNEKKESIEFAMSLQLGLTCQMIQALSLIGIDDRSIHISVIDNKTDDILYDSSETTK